MIAATKLCSTGLLCYMSENYCRHECTNEKIFVHSWLIYFVQDFQVYAGKTVCKKLTR
jgi:hypothetical protein